MDDYNLAFKEALKQLARNSTRNQTEFVIDIIKRFATSEEVKEVGIALGVKLLIDSTKQIVEEIGKKESEHDPVFYLVYKYIALNTVNTLGNEILALYEQDKSASVDEICKGIEALAAKLQSEEYLDDKISKFIEEVKVDKG